MKKCLLFSCLMLFIFVFGRAQFLERQLISPAGDYYTKTNIQMTWVLGDLVTGAYDIGQLIVPYGVNVPQYEESASVVTLFPNPTTDKVCLQFHMDDIANCYYDLYDILGRVIQNGTITSYQTELSFAPFAYGVYLLRIMKESILVQEFKIIKQ